MASWLVKLVGYVGETLFSYCENEVTQKPLVCELCTCMCDHKLPHAYYRVMVHKVFLGLTRLFSWSSGFNN